VVWDVVFVFLQVFDRLFFFQGLEYEWGSYYSDLNLKKKFDTAVLEAKKTCPK